MKNTFSFAYRFFIFSLFFGCNSTESTSRDLKGSDLVKAELFEQRVLHNGEEREYFLYVPDSYNENTEYPVLLNFHGFGGNAKDYINYESDFRDVAEQEGVILVYPQGSLLSGFSHWNAAPMAEDNKSNTDDIGFIELLIRNLQQDLSVDPNRIYATGFSNGGMFSYALGCFTEGLIAGVAAVSGLQLNLEDCSPSHPISVLIAHSTTDDVIPYTGSSDVASVDETVSFWRTANQTSSEAKESRHNLGDETVWIYTYTGGTNGSEVLHYKVDNGMHMWFDHIIEEQSFAPLMWDFLSPQTLSGRED
jgi:polyhydroxybutyrate depolymerase